MSVPVSGFTTAAILSAAASAGAGGTVTFPNGVYTCVGLQALHADQTWLLDRYAVLQKPATSDQNQILVVKANGLRVNGGSFKDTMGNASGHAICSIGYSLDLEDVQIVDARGWGIYCGGGVTTMRGVTINDSLHGAILWGGSTSQRGPDFDRIRIRRTDPAKYGTAGGIHVQGGDGTWVAEPRITNCHIELPSGLAYAAVGIELWYGDHPHVHGNEVIGGRIGYSFYKNYWHSITGNHSFYTADYAHELAMCYYGDISHNVSYGAGQGVNYGVELSNGSSYNNVTDNKLIGFAQDVRVAAGCVGNLIR